MITGHVMDVNGGQLLGFEDYLEDMTRRTGEGGRGKASSFDDRFRD
jgi:hypothetical protein